MPAAGTLPIPKTAKVVTSLAVTRPDEVSQQVTTAGSERVAVKRSAVFIRVKIVTASLST